MFIAKYELHDLIYVKRVLKELTTILYSIIDMKQNNITGSKLNEKLGQFANTYVELLKYMGDL